VRIREAGSVLQRKENDFIMELTPRAAELTNLLENRIINYYTDWTTGFQDAATPIMQGIIDLHHDIFFLLIKVLQNVNPSFVFFFVVKFSILFLFGFVILKMDNESGISGITVDSISSTAGSNPNRRRRRSNTQKRIRRYFARWLVAYTTAYVLDIPDYTLQDWMEIADIMLQLEYDYFSAEKTMSELNAIFREIREQRHIWPDHRDEHPLSETFDAFFD
jgi:hypothetical protein